VHIESDKSPAGVAVQLVSETAADNNVTPTQTVSAPLELAAALTPAAKDKNDIDKFTINLQAGETINITVTGPVLEVCYDTNKIGVSALGGKCKYDFECALGLTCDLDTYMCSKHCTQDADCGGGQACAPVQGVRRCVPATQVASVNTGDTCAPTLDYECKGTNASCLTWIGTPSFCSVPCDPAAGAAVCPSTMECTNVDTKGGTNNVCFNKSGLHLNGELNCQADFQCASGKCSQDAFAFLFAATICECDPANTATCKTNTTCVNVLDMDQQNRCVPNDQLNLANGKECMGNFQCASKKCDADPNATSPFAPYICQ
jgi:hypothetical protein